MKKIFIFLIIPLILTSCVKTEVPKKNAETAKATEQNKVKAIWLAYYELNSFTGGNTEEQFENKLDSAFKTLIEYGFNTVAVQVRPFADAFYKSKLFPSSKYCFGEQGGEMPYDPLEIICKKAKSHNLRIEAWVNPYRVSNNKNINSLSDSNIAKKWYKNKKTKSRVFICKKGIFFNPASKEVRKLIADGVKEIVSSYSVSSVQFDDYFYPAKDETIDKKEYKKYLAKGGKLSLGDFRRKCISDLIKDVYKTVKSVNGEIRFGVSPAADMNENYNNLYADVRTWVGNKGYVDYICPQVYFGFKNVYQPFMFTVKKWMYITNCDMYVGLPLYKAGKADKYAAFENKSIINEFKNNSNIIQRQIVYLSKLDEIKGIYVFSYSCLFEERCKSEKENMIKALKEY